MTFGGQITDEVRIAPPRPIPPQAFPSEAGNGWGRHSHGCWFQCVWRAGAHLRSGSRPPPLPTLPALPSQMAEQLMTLAYDNGINLFDTAEVYAAGK